MYYQLVEPQNMYTKVHHVMHKGATKHTHICINLVYIVTESHT